MAEVITVLYENGVLRPLTPVKLREHQVVNFSYFDTSALLKQYVTETGSPWVQAYISASAELTIFTSTLTAVEATCAFLEASFQLFETVVNSTLSASRRGH